MRRRRRPRGEGEVAVVDGADADEDGGGVPGSSSARRTRGGQRRRRRFSAPSSPPLLLLLLQHLRRQLQQQPLLRVRGRGLGVSHSERPRVERGRPPRSQESAEAAAGVDGGGAASHLPRRVAATASREGERRKAVTGGEGGD